MALTQLLGAATDLNDRSKALERPVYGFQLDVHLRQ